LSSGKSDSSLEQALRALTDAEAIRNLARRYAHSVWQQDAAGAASLFGEDAVMDTGDRPPLVGRKALLEEYSQVFGQSVFHPFIHNHVIDLDGDRATGTCYLDLRAVVEGKRMVGHGHYDDTYVREAGEWKFASRKLTLSEYVEVGDAAPSTL
jgi:uncharacterized protein (TIGR02246 family)